MNTNVKFTHAGVSYVYKGCSVFTLGLASDVVERVLESGERITDHIELLRPEFEIEITFYDQTEVIPSQPVNRLEQFNAIKDLWENKKLFSFTCDIGTFNSMTVMTMATKSTYETGTAFFCKLKIKQVKQIDFEPAVFQYIKDEDGKLVGVAPVGDYDQVTLTRPTKKKQEDGDWYFGMNLVRLGDFLIDGWGSINWPWK